MPAPHPNTGQQDGLFDPHDLTPPGNHPAATLHVGNSLTILPTLPDDSMDAIITDPPYELSFLSKKWDSTGIAYNTALWAECLRVLKPGGLLLAFGGSRTFHRMAIAITDAGFTTETTLHWTYSTGFPKSLDISKALDKAAGAEREVVGVKRSGGASALTGNNADAGPTADKWRETGGYGPGLAPITKPATDMARQWEGWGTALKPSHEPILVTRKPVAKGSGVFVDFAAVNTRGPVLYFGKANKKERPVVDGVTHATVKPVALMRYLVSITVPEGGVVLDPFAGSGTTLEAAALEGRPAVGVELTVEHVPLIEARLQRSGIGVEVRS